jgi:hypothetical protein
MRVAEETRMDPVQVVQDVIDAFNARNVERVVGSFRADAVMQTAAGTVVAQGAAALGAHFGGFLPHSPTLHSEIRGRLHVGAWVVQTEHVTGLALGEPVPTFDIVSAYRVEGGKIVKCIGLH